MMPTNSLYLYPQCESFVVNGRCGAEITKSGMCQGRCETSMADAEGDADEISVLRKVTASRELVKQMITRKRLDP